MSPRRRRDLRVIGRDLVRVAELEPEGVAKSLAGGAVAAAGVAH